MSLERDSERGRLAEAVLGNAVYVEAHEKVEAEIVRKWKESRDSDEREQLHRLLMAMHTVRQAIEGVMRSGQLATAKLAGKPTFLDRIRR